MTAAALAFAPPKRRFALPVGITWTTIGVFAAMALGAFMAVLDIQIVAASLPQIQAGLSASGDEISRVQSAYLIAEVMMIPIAAFLARALSTRVIFAISAAGFVLSSVGCGLSWNLDSLVVMRALQGFIGGAMIPLAFATAFTAFPRQWTGPLSAAMGLIITLAPTLGPTIGGYISETSSWHWLFFVNILPGVIVTTVVWLYCDFDKAEPGLLRRFDVPGFLMMAVSLGFIEYVLEEGSKKDWLESPTIVWMSVIGLACGGYFITRSLKSRTPLVDFTTFANRNFAFGTLAAVGMGLTLFGLVFIMPLFLDRVRGLNSMQIGATLITTGAAMFITAPIAGNAARRMDPRIIAFIGLVLLAISTFSLSETTSEWSWRELFWPQVFRGSGLMCAMASINVIALGTLPLDKVKGAAGLFNLMRNLGGALGLAIINTILSDRASAHARALINHFDGATPVFDERAAMLAQHLAEQGASDPNAAAMKIIFSLVERESFTLAFADVARLIMAACFVAAVFIAFTSPPKPQPQGAAGGH